MNRLALLSTTAITVLFAFVVLVASSAQNAPASAPTNPAMPARVGPPPGNATAEQLETQGDKLRGEKSYTDALDYYRAALKKTTTAALWNKIGITQLQLNRQKDAGKSFDHAIKLDPGFPEAYNNRGAVYYILGVQQQLHAERGGKSVPRGALKNYRKSVREYKKALELRADTASYHANLGIAYFSMKDYPAAVSEYARALQLDPDVLERRSQTGISAQMSSPEDRAYYSFVMARMYANTGNLDRALEYLRRAMEDGYKDIDSVYKDQEFATLRKDPRFVALMASKPAAIPQ